jgi:dihydroorotate dehydrogenase
MGTALFNNPNAPETAVAGLAEYIERAGFSSARELVGALRNK